MRAYVLTHLSDAVLLRDLTALVVQDRTTTAMLLAHIAEVDARHLYLPAGYPSMHAYCVGELRLSEDAAYKRIQAARAARQFPVLFSALAEGRLHLTAVRLLAPYLTEENAEELVAAATHRRNSDIEQLLAHRFPPTPGIVPAVRAIPSPPMRKLAPGQVCELDQSELGGEQVAPNQSSPPSQEGHLVSARFVLQVTIDESTHGKLRYAQELLGHAVSSGDVVQVLDRALDSLIAQLEKRKFAATTEPRDPRHSLVRNRHVPAHVRRAVWGRDGGQCTYVGETGHRCRERKRIEFDHVDPFARGGEATVERMRLRCRAHNQYEAERTFGTKFMQHKRQEARRAVAGKCAQAAAEATAPTEAKQRREGPANEHTRDVLAGLRGLGFRADEARRAAEHSQALHDATLEERIRVALKFLGRKPVPMPQAALG